MEPLTRLQKILTISVLSLALAIIVLDTTLLNVSLETIIHDLNTDIQSIQWVITAYSLTLAALTITGGRFGDIFGRKRMFVAGAIIFAIGSYIVSISTSIPMMLIGVAGIEGIGAALMMPATSSILLSNFQGRERALAFGIWGGIAGGAAALGPVLGGFLTTYYSWRWGFRINIFVAAVLCLGSLIIRDSLNTKEKPTLDIVGVFLSAIGLTSLVFGVIESSRFGWWKAQQIFEVAGKTITFPFGLSVVPFAIAIGLGILALFVLWEKRMEKKGKTPLVSLHLFENRQFVSGMVTTSVVALGQSGLIFSIPIFLQTVRNYSAFETGISLLPMSIMLLIMSPLTAAISGKVPPKRLIQIGLFINIIATLVLRASLTVDATGWSFAPGLLLYGLGMGIVMSQINNVTLSAVQVYESGEASGVNNTFRQIGSSFGSAVIGAVLIGAMTTATSQGLSTAEATVAGNQQSLLFGAIFALSGFLVSFLLPNKTVERKSIAPTAH